MPSGVIDVAAGLVERDGLILITQRKEGSHLAGLWEFPGGKREPAETWQDCLVRELHEELAITVTVGELRYETVHHYPEKSVRLRFYAAVLISVQDGTTQEFTTTGREFQEFKAQWMARLTASEAAAPVPLPFG